jgi:hypothetical protein
LLSMDLRAVTTILGMQLDKWCVSNSFWCPMKHALVEYKQTSALLRACGHDNRELEEAIAGVDKALDVLTAARERAVERFKTEGVSLSVYESKCKEIEARRSL